MKFMLKIFTI